jgi:DNA-binding CsgD family transcriptional regulator
MHLSIKEHEKILDIIDILYNSHNNEGMSQQAGGLLLELLNADYFDLAVKNEQKKRLEHNTIYRKKSAASIDYNTYTYNPLTQGNQHAYFNMSIKNTQKQITEIKIWRTDSQHHFTKKEDYVFEKIKPHFHNAIKNRAHKEKASPKDKTYPQINATYLSQTYTLTSREAQVTLEVLKGKQDENIAKTLNIAFSTLRTHLKNIFSKLHVNSRALLLNRIYLDIFPIF